jgi:hypothetical protein
MPFVGLITSPIIGGRLAQARRAQTSAASHPASPLASPLASHRPRRLIVARLALVGQRPRPLRCRRRPLRPAGPLSAATGLARPLQSSTADPAESALEHARARALVLDFWELILRKQARLQQAS